MSRQAKEYWIIRADLIEHIVGIFRTKEAAQSYFNNCPLVNYSIVHVKEVRKVKKVERQR